MVGTHMHCLNYNAARFFSGATQAHLQSRLPEGAYLYSLTIRVSRWAVQHASRSAMQCHLGNPHVNVSKTANIVQCH
jgi:hypothetical protein